MSDVITSNFEPREIEEPFRLGRHLQKLSGELPLFARYGISLLFVILATAAAFAIERLVATPSVTLIYVLPVVAAATAFGFGPAFAAAVAGVLAFDFFFTEPLYSLRIDSASDVWAAVLLLVVAAIVSAVASKARQRAVDAQRDAEQAQALQVLAHAVIKGWPQAVVVQAAATALNKIFRAPSAVFIQEGRTFHLTASAGRADITPADEEAAQGALQSRLPTRAEIYPYVESTFDFWPVVTRLGCDYALGIDFSASGGDRFDAPERFIEIVGAYLAAACTVDGSLRS